MRLGRALGCVSLIGFAAGCGQAGPEPLGRDSQAIYGGHESGPEDDAVVKVTNVDSNGIMNVCTGSLLAPNVVLTARHCVSNKVQGDFTCTDDGELTPDSQGGRFGSLIDPAQLKIYVGSAFKEPLAALGAQVFATQTPTICRNDIAVIVLDREISGVPLLPVRIDRGNEHGEVLRVAGFGETEDNTGGVRRAKDGIVISQVGTSQFRTNGDAIPPRTFLTLGPALCIGDSGGPALSSDGAVTGVYSQLVGACDSPNARQYFTQVAPFNDEVLTPAFELTGYQPIVEGSTPSEAGAGGSGDGENTGAAGAEDAGATSTSTAGGENGNAGSVNAPSASPAPPAKGGCVCSTTATSTGTSFDRLATLLALGLAGCAVSRRRRQDSESSP